MQKLIFIILSVGVFANVFAENDVKSYLGRNTQYNDSQPENSKFYPFIYFDLKTEALYQDIGNNNFFSINTELLTDLHWNDYFGFHTNFGLEKIRGNQFTPISFQHSDKKESFLYGTSLTAKELSVMFNFNHTKFYLGKIAPKFGAGSERWSDFFYSNWYGISGTFLNKGYTLEDKLGILLDVAVVERENLRIQFQASIFTNDDTKLYKEPFFVEREIAGALVPVGQTTRWAGSEKNILQSQSASVQGFVGVTSRDIISFAVGFKNQASALKYSNATETGFSISGQYTKILLDDLKLSIFLEHVNIWDAYSIKGYSENYFTGGLSASFGGVVVGTVYNNYSSSLNKLDKKIKMLEYFIGFEVPKTELAFFLSQKSYNLPSGNKKGFAVNMKYRIK
jgi:hypothetical protein